MSRFVSNDVTKIELNEKEWVEVRSSLSYNDMLPITVEIDQKNPMNNAKIAIPLLKKALVAWNFKEDDGSDVICNEENIEKLDAHTVLELLPKLTDLYLVEKKN